MLRRLGNKTKLIPDLLDLIPAGITTFIDVFMGTGAVSFAMIEQRRATYVIANDNDAEIFNLFNVLRTRKEDLREAIRLMPYHEGLFHVWKVHREVDPVWKAVRFLMLSNFGYMGQPETLRFESSQRGKLILLQQLDDVLRIIAETPIQFMCCDFRDVFQKICWRKTNFGRKANPKARAFAYFDPPYYDTETNYHDRTCRFQEEETRAVFDIALASGMRFAISEFDNPFVLALAEEYGLHVTELGERRTMKNRNTEILITNYEPQQRTQMALFAA